jgi:hypothetical protein
LPMPHPTPARRPLSSPPVSNPRADASKSSDPLNASGAKGAKGTQPPNPDGSLLPACAGEGLKTHLSIPKQAQWNDWVIRRLRVVCGFCAFCVTWLFGAVRRQAQTASAAPRGVPAPGPVSGPSPSCSSCKSCHPVHNPGGSPTGRGRVDRTPGPRYVSPRHEWRGSQVVRRGSAKSLCIGSIPIRASSFHSVAGAAGRLFLNR